MTAPIERSCFWLATAPDAPERPALRGAARCRIAIVGGGLTGLWAANSLVELDPGASVVLLEGERVAYGGSGRNAGMVGETLDHSHALAIQHFGAAEAGRLARIARQNLDDLESFLRREAIDAELERVGQLFVALSEAHLRDAEASLAAARQLGIDDWRALSAAELRAELASPLYLGGLLAPRAATLHPSKLALGLAVAAERHGVRIHESSRVRTLERRGNGMRLATEAGELVADRVLLATNAYSHLVLPGLRHRFLPLYDYIQVSRPLAPAERAALGWRNRQGVTDLRAFFNYYRLTADDRILWGTSEAVYHRGNYVGPGADHDDAVYAGLAASFRRHFPQLAEVEFPYRWGGPIAATTRLTPFCGARYGGRLLYALGYNGHGLGSTRLAGRLLAHLALARPSELAGLALFRNTPLPYPPEPLRSWAVGAVTRALRRVDAGQPPGLLLRLLDRLGIGFSS